MKIASLIDDFSGVSGKSSGNSYFYPKFNESGRHAALLAVRELPRDREAVWVDLSICVQVFKKNQLIDRILDYCRSKHRAEGL